MRILWFVGLAFAWLVAAPVLAEDEWAVTCEDDPPAANVVDTVGGAGHKDACHNFQTEGTGDTLPIKCLGPSCLWGLNPNQGTPGASTAQGWIRCCFGPPALGFNDNTCIRITDAVLDGTMGAPGTQNAYVRTGPATCYGEVTAGAGGGGENPIFTVRAE